MGTTPIFGFPYPDPSDLVANYPALGQQLAEDVEDAIYARKILQIIRATDVTNRSTTSATLVDVTGMTVTITPQFNTSSVIVIASFNLRIDGASNDNNIMEIQMANASNVGISGAATPEVGQANFTSSGSYIYEQPTLMIGYDSPATTSAVTYKMRFRRFSQGTVAFQNAQMAGQMFAIEVSA